MTQTAAAASGAIAQLLPNTFGADLKASSRKRASNQSKSGYLQSGESDFLEGFFETMIRISTSEVPSMPTKWVYVIIMVLGILQVVAFIPFFQYERFIDLRVESLTYYNVGEAFLLFVNPQFQIFPYVSFLDETDSTAKRMLRVLDSTSSTTSASTTTESTSAFYNIDQYSDLVQEDFGLYDTSSSSVNSSTQTTAASAAAAAATSSGGLNQESINQIFIWKIALQCLLLALFLVIFLAISYIQFLENRGLIIYNSPQRRVVNTTSSPSDLLDYLRSSLRFLFQIYNTILVLPILQITLISSQFHGSYENNSNSQLCTNFLCVVNALICISFSVIITMYCEQSNKVSDFDLIRFHKSWVYIASNLFKIISCIIFSTLVDTGDLDTIEKFRYPQLVLVSIYLLLQIIDVHFNIAFSNIRMMHAISIVSRTALCFALTFTLCDKNQISDKEALCILILSSIILGKLTLNLTEKKMISILIKSQNAISSSTQSIDANSSISIRERVNSIALLYSFMRDSSSQSSSSSNLKILVSSLLSQHKNICCNQLCFCQRFESAVVNPPRTDCGIESTILIDQEFLKKYVLICVDSCLRAMKVNEADSNNSNRNNETTVSTKKLNDIDNQILQLQLISLLNDLKYCARSLQLLFALRSRNAIRSSDSSSISGFEIGGVATKSKKQFHSNSESNQNKPQFSVFMGLISSSLRYSIKLKLIEIFRENNTPQQMNVGLLSTEFLRASQAKASLRFRLIKSVSAKVSFYDSMLSGKFCSGNSSGNIIKQAKLITEDLESIEREVYKLYRHSRSSQKELNVLLFFLAEIRNDYFTADAHARQIRPFDSEAFQQLLKITQLVLPGSIHYTMVSYGEEKGKVISQSTNMAAILGFDPVKTSCVRNVNELVPAPMDRYHNIMVTSFLEAGNSKSLRALSKFFYTDKLGYAQAATSFFDLDIMDFTDLVFIAYLRPEILPVNRQVVYMFFNEKGKLESASYNALTMLLTKRDRVKFEQSGLKGMHWSGLIQDIESTISEMKQKGIRSRVLYQVEVHVQLSNRSFVATLKIDHKYEEAKFSYYVFTFSEFAGTTNKSSSEEKATESGHSQGTSTQSQDENEIQQSQLLQTLQNHHEQKETNYLQIHPLITTQENTKTLNPQINLIKANKNIFETTQNDEGLAEELYLKDQRISSQEQQLQNPMTIQLSELRTITNNNGVPASQPTLFSQEQLFVTEQDTANKDIFPFRKIRHAPTTVDDLPFESTPQNTDRYALNSPITSRSQFQSTTRSITVLNNKYQNNNLITRNIPRNNNNNNIANPSPTNNQLKQQISQVTQSKVTQNHHHQEHSKIQNKIINDQQFYDFEIGDEKNITNLYGAWYQEKQISQEIDANRRISLAPRLASMQKSTLKYINSNSEVNESETRSRSRDHRLQPKNVVPVMNAPAAPESSIQRSKLQHYTRYKSFSQFVNSQSSSSSSSSTAPSSIKLFVGSRVCEILLVSIITLIFLISIRTKVDTLKENTQVLRFQSEILGPTDSFIGLYWQAINSYYALAFGKNTVQAFTKMISFIQTQQQYEAYRLTNFTQSMSSYNIKLQDFLNSNTELYLTDFMRGKVLRNVTHQNMILGLVRYDLLVTQYNWPKLAQTVNVFQPDLVFVNTNTIEITTILNNISAISFEDVSNTANEFTNSVDQEVIGISIIVFVSMALSVFFLIRFEDMAARITELFRHCDRFWVEEELARNQMILTLLSRSTTIDPFEGYKFSLQDKEDYLSKMQRRKAQARKTNKLDTRHNDLRLHFQTPFNKISLVAIFIFIIGINIGCLIFVSLTNQKFINTFLNVSTRFQNLADYYSVASRLSGVRDYGFALDAKLFPYLNQLDLDKILSSFDTRIALLENFLKTQLIQIDSSVNTIPEIQSYIDFVKYSNQANLCDHVIHARNQYLTDCKAISNGVLQKGVAASLSQIINEFRNERRDTNFVFNSRQPQFPNGDAIMTCVFISRVLKHASDMLYSGLQDVCDNSWTTILLVIVGYFCFVIAIDILLIIVGYARLTSQFKLLKKSILLIPVTTMSLENSFSTSLRIINNKYHIHKE